jgi:hypothetical protein
MLKFRNQQVINICLFVCLFVCCTYISKRRSQGLKHVGSTFCTDGRKEIVVGKNEVTSPRGVKDCRPFPY